MNESREKVGFVGLGVMGSPMVSHLARAGFAVGLFDVRHETAQALAATLGGRARAFSTLPELAAKSDIVVTMLPNGEVVREVILGEGGLIQSLKAGSLVVDTSSSEPWITQETAAGLAGEGIAMVDAPVSGAQIGAQRAELVFMVGGKLPDIARVRPLLEAMGKTLFHLGPLGSGHAMKCINNCITSVVLSATAEGLISGQRYGLDPAVMVDVLNASTGGSWVSSTHFHQRILNRKFDDPFKLELMLKDVRISTELARSTGTPVPFAALTEQLWRMADHKSGKGASVSEVVRWFEDQSGTPLVPGGGAPDE